MSDVPEHVRECAEWFVDGNPRYWRSRRLLLDWVCANGPIRLEDGRLLGFQADGFAYDGDAVAREFPELIRNAEITFTGPLEKVERVLSMALEELPDIEYAVKRAVDATTANNVIRAGGDAADRLLPLRVTKSKLGVK